MSEKHNNILPGLDNDPEFSKIATTDLSLIKKGKFKRSGHLTDQMLKYHFPDDNKPTIWDSIKESTKSKIEKYGIAYSEIIEGIKLSPAETKMIDCFSKILHSQSQNSDAKRADYYTGIGSTLVSFSDEVNTEAPKVAFTLYELAKEYKGGEKPSGKDINNVKNILTELDKKKFLLSYVETTFKHDGGRIERKIEDYVKLIHIVIMKETEYSKDGVEINKTQETIVMLNPIFRRQIDNKYILYPNDITNRTISAYGSHNLPETLLRLRDYLLREMASNRFEPEITVEKLYYLLAEKWMKESRRKKVKEYTEKSIETLKNMGIILDVEIKPASDGTPKMVFKLNKEWE